MRIAFADFNCWDFHAQSADCIPLGGSQSAACHLARSLARDGHEVILLSWVSKPGIYDGVPCLSWKQIHTARLRALDLDVLVCLIDAGNGARLRAMLGPKTLIILWAHHAHDQPGVASLRDAPERTAYDGFAMVSEWQRERYERHFGIEPARMAVLRNAIAPAFAHLFAEGESILDQKTVPPVLAYTSTPFRGLDLLLQVFPRIREAVPGVRLQVFSSMRVYLVSPLEDEALYGALYRRCRETEGVEYIGSVPQPELARALRGVSVLAYPNTFPETSCIVMMEAMASGCRVVTSHRGALPETGAGFARLIPGEQDSGAYREQFIEETVQVLREGVERREATEQLLRAQVAHINATATWDLRAGQWIEWLRSLSRETRGA